MKSIDSTKTARNVIRIQSGAEIAGNGMLSLVPSAKIPIKVAQSIACLFTFFNPNTTKFEKAISLAQASLCIGQVGMIMYVMSTIKDCTGNGSVCVAINICDLVYQGILLSSIGISELNKMSIEDDPSQPSSQTLSTASSARPT